MTELKISCPKCGGHISFPPEIAGQEISCPHCQEAVMLAKRSQVTVWVLTAVALIAAVCVGPVFALKHRSKPGERSHNLPARPLSQFELLEARATKGDTEAMAQLGLLYITGNGDR